jgi:hypothetical protein
MEHTEPRLKLRRGSVASGPGSPVATLVARARARARRRRRVAVLVVLAVGGLGLGSVWASGFASSQATAGSSANSALSSETAAATTASQLASTISNVSTLTIGFSGRWGTIASSTPMFKIDLDTLSSSQKFTLASVLSNDPYGTTGNGWSSLQIQFTAWKAPTSGGTAGQCLAADMTGTSATSQTMPIETLDPEADFSTLASSANIVGGNNVANAATYCIGVKSASLAQSVTGTFIRRASSSSTPTVMPAFTATVNPIP